MTAKTKPSAKLQTILLAGLLAGTLDAIAACIWASKIKPEMIFRYIASGVFGKRAFTGGFGMVMWGLFFHYLIAVSFTAVLFLMYPSFLRLLKNKYVVVVAFAAITWVITNLVIVPLSQIGWKPIHLQGICIGFGILIVTIGLPVTLIADWFYSRLLK